MKDLDYLSIMHETRIHWFERDDRSSRQFQVHGLGVRQPMRPGRVWRPWGTGDGLWMFFHAPVAIGLDGEPRWCHQASAMLWPDGAGHDYGNTRTDWCHSWLHWEGAWFDDVLLESRLPVGRPLALTDLSGIDGWLTILAEELTRPDGGDPPIVESLVRCLAREVRRAWADEAPSSEAPAALLKAKAYMDKHFASPLTLSRLARQANLSIPHFCSRFRASFGVPPMEYVIARRLRLAVYYLRDHNLLIQEVAERVGYSDPCYFSRLIRKRYGCSPLALRRTAMDVAAGEDQA